MSSFISPVLDQFMKTKHNKIEQFFYHHPMQGKMGGWAVALAECVIHEAIGIVGLVDSIAMGIINGLGATFSETCRSNFKASFKNFTRYGLLTLLAIPKIGFDIFNYWNKAEENAKKARLDNWQPIHFAVVNNDIAFLQQLLDQNVDLNARTSKREPSCFSDTPPSYSDTALHLAAKYGHETAVRLLVKKGADLSSRNDIEFTPLDYAVVTVKPKMINVLAELGANLNAKNKYGYAPIHHAVMEKFELPNWASVEYTRKDFASVIEALAANKADVNATTDNNSKSTALLLAACSLTEQTNAVAALLKVKANPNIASSVDKSTALHVATERNHLEKVKLLSNDPSVDVNAKDAHDRTAMHLAATKVSPQMALLLAAVPRINRNSQDNFGRTAYHIAYQRKVVMGVNGGDTTAVVESLSKICDVNIRDIFGKKAEEYQANSMFGSEPLSERVEFDIRGITSKSLKALCEQDDDDD